MVNKMLPGPMLIWLSSSLRRDWVDLSRNTALGWRIHRDASESRLSSVTLDGGGHREGSWMSMNILNIIAFLKILGSMLDDYFMYSMYIIYLHIPFLYHTAFHGSGKWSNMCKRVPPRWGCFLLGPWLWEEVSEGHWKKKSLQIIAAIYEVLVLRKVVVKYIFLGSVKELQVQNTFEGWHSKEHLPAIWAFLKPNWDLLRYFGACKVIAHSTGSICERQSQPTSQNKTKIYTKYMFGMARTFA